MAFCFGEKCHIQNLMKKERNLMKKKCVKTGKKRKKTAKILENLKIPLYNESK